MVELEIEIELSGCGLVYGTLDGIYIMELSILILLFIIIQLLRK